MIFDSNIFDIENNVRHILAHARNGGKFMQHTIDMDRGDCSSLQRGEQHATQGVAKRYAKTTLQRLCNRRRHTTRIISRRDFEFIWFNQFLPVLLDAHWGAFP